MATISLASSNNSDSMLPSPPTYILQRTRNTISGVSVIDHDHSSVRI